MDMVVDMELEKYFSEFCHEKRSEKRVLFLSKINSLS